MNKLWAEKVLCENDQLFFNIILAGWWTKDFSYTEKVSHKWNDAGDFGVEKNKNTSPAINAEKNIFTIMRTKYSI